MLDYFHQWGTDYPFIMEDVCCSFCKLVVLYVGGSLLPFRWGVKMMSDKATFILYLKVTL